MRFQFTKEQEEYRQEVCGFLTKELTPEIGAKYGDHTCHGGYKEEYVREFRKRLAERGLIGVGWPKEYGGGGRDMIDQVIFMQEIDYYKAPWLDGGITMLAPPIWLLGTEEQKKFFLPRIRSGECRIFLGYSEPEAGSDLANLKTRAVADGDDFIINGNKLYMTEAEHADYGWVAARTDPDVPKHKGISLFLVDTKLPGITITMHKTLSEWYHAEVFFDNVRVPKTALVGELNRGWYHIMTALSYERATIGNPGLVLRNFHRLLRYCRETKRNGQPLTKDPEIRRKLAELAVEVEAAYVLAYWIASMHVKGLHPQHETSVSHLYKRETLRKIDYAGIQIMSLYAQLWFGSKGAPAGGWMIRDYLDNIYYHFAVGGFDVNRNILAIRGLGLPR